MKSVIKQHLESQLSEPIKKVLAVSGGDISEAYRIETATQNLFVKSTTGHQAKSMYLAEAQGLQQLASSQTIGIPKVVVQGNYEDISYLVLDFIESKKASSVDFERLGHKLAELHQYGNCDIFGNDHNNFIGSLPQSNKRHRLWTQFFIKERLLPQFNLAQQKGLLNAQQIPSEKRLYEGCDPLFGMVKPSLLHGDHWSGNYLIASNGNPYLIDPAVYYGHSEVDLAMSKLFGGFGDSFYGAYHEIIPPHENQKALTEIYQLYYLLVHLNLFGTSYLGSVMRILDKYFG